MNNVQVVPWYDSEEWFRVYSALFGANATDVSKNAALSTLLAWKARQPALVSAIESTLCLLEVKTRREDEHSNERVLRLAYSAAIMRFVNHMLDTEQSKGSTLYRAARKADLPDWVIDLRHSAAHGDSLPSLSLLVHASDVALNWLRKNYWELQKESMADYIVSDRTISEDDERRISRMMSFCTSLSMCSRGEPKIKLIRDIPSVQLRQSIFQEAKDLFEDEILNIENITLKNLILLLKKQLSKMIKSSHMSSIVINTLLDDNSLFLSLEVLRLFDRSWFTDNVLSPEYVRSWDVLLEIVHSSDLLLRLVEELIGISEDCNRQDTIRKLAALWVREILCGLKRVKVYKEKLKMLKSTGQLESITKKKNHKTIFKEFFPKENNGLTLCLTNSIPKEICSLSYINPIIKSYNAYLHLFIKELLILQEPRLDSFKENRLCKLAQLISGRNVPESAVSQVYTVAQVCEESYREMETSDSDCVEVEMEQDFGAWKIASNEYDWEKCPIGILPWQMKGTN